MLKKNSFKIQTERKIRNLLKRQEDIEATTKEKKVQLWELNGHIKKVRVNHHFKLFYF